MEMSGVTCCMDSSSTAVKDNRKLCNYHAIDMIFFQFQLDLVWRVQDQNLFYGKRYGHNKGIYLILLYKRKIRRD